MQMRIKKIYCKEVRSARIIAPWLVKILKMQDHFLVFESINDFNKWMGKK